MTDSFLELLGMIDVEEDVVADSPASLMNYSLLGRVKMEVAYSK